MKFKISLVVFFAFTLFYSCKKNDNKNDGDTQQTTKISGKIKFPTGSNLSPSGCSVNSYITDQTLSDENYFVDTVINAFNIQFLTSPDGKELMLGYTYPSQTDFTIDSKSTLLALVMKLPAVNSLSTSGKLNFINKIKTSPGYTEAINAIENHIIAGQDIFDTTDVNMQKQMASLFDYAATHREGFGYDGQIYINKRGKTLTFGNPGVSIAQVIGIYQGSNRIAKLELDRYQTFVTSIAEIPSAINNPPSPIEVNYDFQNDGIYQIKIRSGGFNLPNNDLESSEAIKTNAWNLVSDNLTVFIPINLSKKCPEAVNNAIESGVETFKSAMQSSVSISMFLGIVYNSTKTVIQSVIINTCINGDLGEIRYLKKILKYLKWLDVFGKIGTELNTSIFITDFFIATKSSLDTTITIGNTIPILTTNTQSSVTSNSAISGGNITNDGGSPIISRGTCWSTSSNPTIANSKTSDGSGTGSFTSNLTGLTNDTTYYIRAYATNSTGTAYGNEVNFTTLKLPKLTTSPVSSVTQTTAVSGGNVADGGGLNVTARGVCWATSPNPTVALSSNTNDGNGVGSFVSNLTGLTENETYYIRAYATNSAGTAYGNEVSFTTVKIKIPSLTTSVVSSTTQTTAVSGGTVTDDGGGNVTVRGVCWSTSSTPTIALSTKTNNGSGVGTFVSNLTSLTENKTYYIRAYATNSAGTAYGNEVSFTTVKIKIPSLTTNVVSSITQTTAVSGGMVTDDGGGNVTARGVCWSTSSNPTFALSTKTNDGSGVGTFVSNLTSLTENKTYYLRAYATNSAGTAYGNEISFNTSSPVSLKGLTFSVISELHQSVPGNVGAVYEPGMDYVFDTESTFSVIHYSQTGPPYSGGSGYSYYIGQYYSDSLTFVGDGSKLPPGYDIKLSGQQGKGRLTADKQFIFLTSSYLIFSKK